MVRVRPRRVCDYTFPIVTGLGAADTAESTTSTVGMATFSLSSFVFPLCEDSLHLGSQVGHQ
jgi:hypothetical protein